MYFEVYWGNLVNDIVLLFVVQQNFSLQQNSMELWPVLLECSKILINIAQHNSSCDNLPAVETGYHLPPFLLFCPEYVPYSNYINYISTPHTFFRSAFFWFSIFLRPLSVTLKKPVKLKCTTHYAPVLYNSCTPFNVSRY